MALKVNSRRFNLPGPITVGLLLLSLFLLVINTQGAKKIGSLLRLDTFKSSSVVRETIPSASDEKTAAALNDAVISIVQNYYVDNERIDNAQLLRGTARSLAFAIPESEFEETEDSFTLKIRGVGITIEKLKELDYDRLLASFKVLAKFCSEARLGDLVTSSSSIMLGTEKKPATLLLNAMLSALDAHSSLMSPDGYRDLRQGTDGAFGGLGVLVAIKNHQLTVLKPMPRSPAQRMGLKKGDHIVTIDGFPTFGLSLDQLVSHMRGEPGSSAKLAILRDGAARPFDLSVPREIIEVDSVESKHHHKGNIHYLHLTIDSFSARTAKEVLEAIESFKAKFPVSGVVLDLRSNPGGLLDQAVEVSDIFLKSGVIVSTRGRKYEVERATTGVDELEFPVIVLMNEDSASASEIVAGALQDNGRAIVIGQPSFGKGSVQTLFELPAERALKLTIARYLTPSNRSIQNTGIMPDVWVQPVRERSQNLNLFGSYRYRSEAFLPNHLSSVSIPKVSDAPTPVVKGFYLKKADSQSGQPESDEELELAELIFTKINSLYGTKLPEGVRRASHLLAVTLPQLRLEIGAQTRHTANWLKQNLAVDWSESPSGPRPSLSLDIGSEKLVGRSGRKLSVPWKITNHGLSDASHISLYVQSQISGIETFELLVGNVKRGETRTGSIAIDLPASLQPGAHRVVAGVASEAIAIDGTTREFSILVKPGHFSEALTKIKFIDGHKSLVSGYLEPGESGILEISVSNVSQLDIENFKLDLVNLAGSQVKLGRPEFSAASIGKSSQAQIRIPIDASNNLASDSVDIGYVIKAESLDSPVAKVANIKASLPQLTRASDPLTH